MRKQYQGDYELNGVRNGKKTYQYVGRWYHIPLEPKEYRKFWILQLLPTISLYAIYAALPFGASFILLLFFLIEAAFCPFRPEKMERMQYEQQYGRLRKISFANSILFSASFVTNLIATLVHSAVTPQSLIQLALLLALSLLGVILYRVEKKLPVEMD